MLDTVCSVCSGSFGFVFIWKIGQHDSARQQSSQQLGDASEESMKGLLSCSGGSQGKQDAGGQRARLTRSVDSNGIERIDKQQGQPLGTSIQL